MNNKPVPSKDLLTVDYVLETLYKMFFALAKEEKFPKTPKVTEELDYLTEVIKELEEENGKNTNQKNYDKK